MTGHGGRPRVVGLLRVSTDDQAEHGHGLEYQRRALEVWAAHNGLELVTFYADEGVSGSAPLTDRPGLAYALGMVADGLADGIAVWKLDRLARDVVLQEFVIRELARTGGRLWSTFEGENENLGDNESDPTRKLTRVILGALAEYESAMITMRMQAGKAVKRSTGGFCGGVPPFGTRLDGHGGLEADPAELVVVDRMVALRAGGMSYQGIADTLMAEGMPPRSGSWYGSGVRDVLRRVAPSVAERKPDTLGFPWDPPVVADQ